MRVLHLPILVLLRESLNRFAAIDSLYLLLCVATFCFSVLINVAYPLLFTSQSVHLEQLF